MKENLLHSLDFDGLENQMEGKFRPAIWRGWHYCKAPFEIVAPTNIFWKDFQQLQIVKKMVANNLSVNVMVVQFTVKNNLAMSSRNEQQKKEQKRLSSTNTSK
jgi:pantoate--beta-alanine ligase